MSERGALLPRNAALSINLSKRSIGSPLTASLQRFVAMRALPTRSRMPGADLLRRIGVGVLERYPSLK